MKEDAIDTTFVVAKRKPEEIQVCTRFELLKKISLSWIRQLQFTTAVLRLHRQIPSNPHFPLDSSLILSF